jgi:hypothetical protein
MNNNITINKYCHYRPSIRGVLSQTILSVYG